jgi:multiple sugar transport system substrate-binding protein
MQAWTKRLLFRWAGRAGSLAAAAAVGACGSPSGSAAVPAAQPSTPTAAPTIRLELGTWGDLTGGLADAFPRQFKRFQEQNPNIETELRIAAFSDYQTQLFANLAAGQPYPIFVSGNYWTFEFSASKFLLELTDRVKRDLDVSKLSPVAVRSGTDDKGRIWGVARTANVAVLYYNKAHFDEAGMTYPDPTWTYDDILKAAKQLTRSSGGQVERYGWYARNFISSDWVPLTHSFGGGFINAKDWTQMTINRPENVEALQWDVDMIHRHQVAPTGDVEKQLNDQYGSAGEAVFAAGKAAMMNGIDQVGYWGKDLRETLKFDATYVAKGPKDRRSAAPTHHYVIARTVKPEVADAAWKLMKFLLLDLEAHVDVAVGIRFIPMLKAAYDDPRILHRALPPDNMKAFIDPLVQGWADDIDVNGVYRKWTDLISAPMAAVWRGEQSVKQALDQVQPLAQQAADDFFKNAK